jgi:subtilisin family serine protease
MKVGILRSAIFAAAVGCSTFVYAQAPSTETLVAQEIAAEFENYLVVLGQEGLLYYGGGVPGLRATAPSATGTRKLDMESSATVAYQSYLAEAQRMQLGLIEKTLEREFPNAYFYDVTFSALGLRLTPEEASAVRQIPGVNLVERVESQPLATHSGAQFIGAQSVWNGQSTPGNVQTRGQGTIVGVIDTGINREHPAFGKLRTECGAAAGETKLLSAYNCLNGNCTTVDLPGASCQVDQGIGTAQDCNGHGSHVASTAAGNGRKAKFTVPPEESFEVDLSGMAPCAKIRSYKVCGTEFCDGLAITAAINKAIADGVDVINFSISGGGGDDSSIWSSATSDRLFLDALNADILVAAAAGNTSADNLTPTGDVNHRGPWLTSVAASSNDFVAVTSPVMQVTGPGMIPGNLAGDILMTKSTSPFQVTPGQAIAIKHFDAAPFGCADTQYPEDFFNGGAALISRGVCSFEEKVEIAIKAGASLVLIYNNAPGTLVMGGLENAQVPAYMLVQSSGQALVNFAATLNGAPITALVWPSLPQGDVLADFSLRGPITPVPSGAEGSNNAFDVTKPDITAPGISVYAAIELKDYNAELSGTSMASPHVAGAFALVRALRPEWTASEIKSAMMMTAQPTGTKEDASTPWDLDDVGNGRVDLGMTGQASRAGLVMDETFVNFLAANPSQGGNPRALNLPSLRHTTCSPSCTWTRTVKSTLPESATWKANIESPPGFDLTVEPAEFTLMAPGTTQVLTIKATPHVNEPGQQVRMGRIKLSTNVAQQSPDLRIGVAVKRAP